MRPLLLALLCATAFAQPVQRSSNNVRVAIDTTLAADPPTSTLLQRFAASTRYSPNAGAGPAFNIRIIFDPAKREYFGYELLLERPQPGVCLATFGRLGITPLNLAAILSLRGQQAPLNQNWTALAQPALPEPRVLHNGDRMTVELLTEPVTGDKLIDLIQINFVAPPPPPAWYTRPIPTVSGPARDYAATDADLILDEPRVFLNGERQVAPGAALHEARGPLVWLYLPEHGRYVLSLVPRPGFDFKKSGEVRGGTITFAIDGDAIKLDSTVLMASGESAYNVYVLRDRAWEPISDRQKDQPVIGTVSAEELAALKLQKN